jgi:hypothetical protein
MSRQIFAAVPDFAVGLLTLLFAALCAAFVWQPGLASFADDSVSYVVMAQVFSPWQAASPPVSEAFAREAFYPPLYPLLLGLTGVAHDMALAHAVTAILLAACLPLVYALGIRWLGNKWAAAAAALATAVMPALWINAKGLLSEPLYCLALLATLCILERQAKGSKTNWALAISMSAMVLTRTAGLALVAAYGLWALTRRDRPLAARAHALLPALVAALAYVAWVLLRPAGTSDDYARIVHERIQAFAGGEQAWLALGASLLRQANAVAEGWIGSLLIFWVEGRPARMALAGAVGCLALAAIGMRMRAGKADAWIMAAYLATFLLWPFHDQMTRFLLPALPVLVLYSFWMVGAAMRLLGRPAALAHGVLAMLLLSLAVPALAFIRERAGAPEPQAAMTEWYRRPDLEDARARAEIHLDLLADMQVIKTLTQPEHRIMWVVPSYIALLADRRGVPAPPHQLAPEAYRRAVREATPDYIFLSLYHPRDTISDDAWRAGTAAMMGHAEVVHMRTRAGGAVSSVLLKAGP